MPPLALPQPYDFALSTERFRTFGLDRATLWHEGGLHRVVRGRELRIEPAPGGVLVEPLAAEQEPEVLHLLGSPFDLEEFASFAEGEPVLARLVRELAGFRPPLVPDPFEAIVTSITAQQVSLLSAVATRNRLTERFGGPGSHARAFPTAERLARVEPEELLPLGFSGRKAEYVVGLARAELDWAGLASAPDEAVKERLVELRGLGEWTADWFLARHLARPRAWPAGDLGVRKAVEHFYGPEAAADVRAFGARFAPFENLSVHYLLTGHRVTAR